MGSEMCIRDRTRPVPSMRGLLRRASGDMGEFTNPREWSQYISISYSNVNASSIAGMCENAIMSSEFQFSVLMMGWLCKILNLACWKQGHSLSRWSKVSGSSSQKLHSSETSSGYIMLWR